MLYEKIVVKLHMRISQVSSIPKTWISKNVSTLFIDVSFYHTRQNFQTLSPRRYWENTLLSHTRNYIYIYLWLKYMERIAEIWISQK